MLSYRFHPAAAEELLEAGEYIKADDPEEGDLFKQDFAKALDWACSQPLIFRCFDGDFRKVRAGKFRYSLVFRVWEDEIQILAVAHMSQRPGYWKERAQNWPQSPLS
jgi:plasmid stabilization system protein ParE